jgi:hypothetical protein
MSSFLQRSAEEPETGPGEQMKVNQQKTTESRTELGTRKAELIKALAGGATITDATRQANIDRTTFYV